ncbi:MAG: alpha-amlyase, partial [Cytophagaceae bacterium]
ANVFTGKGLTARQLEAKEFMKQLLQWRKQTPVVQTGKLKHFAASNGIYVYFRYNESQKVMVVMNKNTEAKSLDMTRYAELLSGHQTVRNIQTNQAQALSQPLTVPATSAVILEVK